MKLGGFKMEYKMEYIEYLKEWMMSEHKDDEAPLCKRDWEKSYVPTSKDWEELEELYIRLRDIADEIVDIRLGLSSNPAFKKDNKDWNKKIDVLIEVGSKIAFERDGFGVLNLLEYFPYWLKNEGK